MNDAAEKSIAQVAYETFLEEIAKTDDAAEVHGAPCWDTLPDHVRVVIANAVGAAVRSFAPALIADVSPEEQSFAQIGYQAYVASTGGLNYQGLPCPAFETLPAAIQAAWAAASTSVRSEHEHRFAGDYDLAFSHEELAELVAGLDALQRADKHTAELAFPLRSRLRGILFPPEEAPETIPEPVGAAPELEAVEVSPAETQEPTVVKGAYDDYHDAVGNPDAKPMSSPSDEVIADDALDLTNGATESTGAEPADPATKTEPSPPSAPADASEAPKGDVQLPAVSEAPAAPGLAGLEPVIPGPPAMPTDIDAPATTELDAAAPLEPPVETGSGY